MEASPLIEVRNVSFRYGHTKMALAGVNLVIPAGMRVALVGSNGAGKSTLFLHLNAILRPAHGQLLFRGQPYQYNRQFVGALRQKVGLVFQDPDTQLFADNVLDDVMFGPVNLELTVAEARKRAMDALTSVQMQDCADSPTHFLSHGQKKRVAIAGILAMDPDVMIMDEPTAGLDYPSMVRLRETINELYRAGKTLLIATHDIDWAWEWADLVYVMAKGQVIAGGRPEDILNCEEHLQLGFSRPIVGKIYSSLVETAVDRQQKVPRNIDDLLAVLRSR